MNTEKFTIKNRLGLRVVIQVDTPENPTRLAFIAHGQGGFIAQSHIEAFTRSFLENGYTVVRFDATHALGESDGDIKDVTYDSYVNDLEDVISWARSQEWYMTPFALCGHSMGAQSVAWYAEHHPNEVNLLAPMAAPINYELHSQTIEPDELAEWKRVGVKELRSRSKPGVVKQVGWNVEESLKKFDLLPHAKQLTMPVLNVVGEFDKPCPAKHQEIFMDSIKSTDKTLMMIEGVEHSYRNAESFEYDDSLNKVEVIMTNWLKERAI